MSNKPKIKVLMIDNFDSFVHNLADEFARFGCQVDVYRNDWALNEALSYIQEEQPDLLVFSPGPGHPKDATLCLALLEHAPVDLPILGVCLGHQCIAHYFGGSIAQVDELAHGKPANLFHQQSSILKGIINPMQVGRYHSLYVETLPDVLRLEATCEGMVMGFEHKERPIIGLQFHPESVLTPEGSTLIQNLITQYTGGENATNTALTC